MALEAGSRRAAFVMRGSGVQFPPAAPYAPRVYTATLRGRIGSNVPDFTL